MIHNLIKEIRYEIFKYVLLITFLRTILAFFIFDIFKSIFDLSFAFSYIFASLFFMVTLFRQIRIVNVKVFEEHNPDVKEMLSTAADNINENNPVVQGLFKDVLEKARRLSSGTIVVPSTIMIIIISIPLLAVLDYELSPLRISILTQDKLLETLKGLPLFSDVFKREKPVEGDIINDELLEEDIYGDRSVATLGNEEINIKMLMGFETDLTRPKEEDHEAASFTDYPELEDVEINYDPTVLQENIEESDLAKKYNEKIRNIE